MLPSSGETHTCRRGKAVRSEAQKLVLAAVQPVRREPASLLLGLLQGRDQRPGPTDARKPSRWHRSFNLHTEKGWARRVNVNGRVGHCTNQAFSLLIYRSDGRPRAFSNPVSKESSRERFLTVARVELSFLLIPLGWLCLPL